MSRHPYSSNPSKSSGLVSAAPPAKPQTALLLLHQRQNHVSESFNSSAEHYLSLLLPPARKGNTSREQQEGSRKILRMYNGITEIAGEAGTGKTQIGLSLCVSSILCPPDLGSSPTFVLQRQTQKAADDVGLPLNPASSFVTSPSRAIYISMGGNASTHSISTIVCRRLRQMIQHRLSSDTSQNSPCGSRLEEIILSKIYIKVISNIDQFQDLLGMSQFQQLPLQRCGKEYPVGELETSIKGGAPHVKVVVIDSIGGLFRIPEDEMDSRGGKFHRYIRQRSTILFEAAAILKRLSDVYSVPIVILNQVAAALRSSGKSPVQPSLGLSWSNCVNVRYMLTRWDSSTSNSGLVEDEEDSSYNENQSERAKGRNGVYIRRCIAAQLSPRSPIAATTASSVCTRGREGIVFFQISAVGVREIV